MQTNDAIKGFTGFLKRLRFTGEEHDLSDGFTTLIDSQLGGLMLTGSEWNEYVKCIDDMVESVSKQESFSRRGVERLLKTAILKAADGEKVLEQIPEERIRRAVDWLRDAMRAKPKTYLVYLPVVGLDAANLPLKAGKVTFLPGDGRTVASVKRPISTIIATLKNEEASRAKFRNHISDDINNSFRNNVIAELEILAGDDDNAEEKAVRECRRTIDAVNFFSDILVPRGRKACLSLLGEGNQTVHLARERERVKLMVMLREKGEEDKGSIRYKGRKIAAFQCPTYARGPLVGLTLPRPDSAPAIDSGFARVLELLGKGVRTSLDERVLAAFQWAGRATVDIRREEAFLLYMIALESLVLGSRSKSEVTFQLRIKTGHLIKSGSEGRKSLLRRLGVLYDIRSKIVHSGSFQVTDSELREARYYSKQAVLTVADNEPFKSMQSEQEFDEWLEDRLLS
jgi:hypothetical protein